MDLPNLTEITDRKINENMNKVVFSFFETKVKYNFSKEDIEHLKTRLENLGYKCYFENQQYQYQGELHHLDSNEVMVAIRKNL